MKKLRAAILGQGRSGRDIHGLHLRELKNRYKIVAAVDPIKKRRDRAAQEFGCDIYADHKPLLARDDIDLIVNATPSKLRVPTALEFFRAGFNVLCDKPLAKRAADVDRMIAAAQKSGVVFAVFQQSRFAPYFRQIRKVLASGVLGRIVQVTVHFNAFSRRWDWQTFTDCHGGNLLNTGPHPLDQVLRLLDLPTNQVPEVFCHMDRAHFFGDAEGHVNLFLRAPGRPIVSLEVSNCCAYPSFTYNIYGTQGGLKGNAQEIQWRYFKPSEAPRRRGTRRPIETAEGTPAYCTETLKWYENSWAVPKAESDLFRTMGNAFYRNLHAHMTRGTALEVSPDQVRQQIAVIEKAHKQNPAIWGKK